MNRDIALARVFTRLADTLATDFDVIELAQQLVESAMALLPIDAAGIVVADLDGSFQVLASNSEQAHLLEVFQTETDRGPCMLAFHTGEAVVVEDLTVDIERWPEFADRALEYGFRSVHALPLRMRVDRVGALNLLRFDVGPLSTHDVEIGQALANLATLGIMHRRITTQADVVNQQLQTALNTRMVIEQAKGVLSERGGVDMDHAFNLLRAHARSTRRRLADIARGVVDGADTTAILDRG
jgi:GAF domain-containing protein